MGESKWLDSDFEAAVAGTVALRVNGIAPPAGEVVVGRQVPERALPPRTEMPTSPLKEA